MYLDSSGNNFTFQGMITLVEGLAIISTAVVVMYYNLFASESLDANKYICWR